VWVGTGRCTLTDRDHQDSIGEATRRFSSPLPKQGRNCEEHPAASGGQALAVAAASQEVQGPYPHSDVSHFNLHRREVHRNGVSRTQQCHPLTENVISLLFIKIISHEHCLSPSQTQRPNKALAKTHFAGLGEAPVVSSLAR